MVLASLLAASNAITIDCNYASADWGYGLGSKYTCQATIGTLDNNEAITAVTDSTGSATPGLTNSDVEYFYLYGYNLRIETIPSNFATIFPNLLGIYWVNTKLRTISPSDLSSFPNLVIISVGTNMITKLDGNLFQNNHQLLGIDLTNNRIREIGPGLLSGLNSLTYFNILGNICTGSTLQLFINPPYITLAKIKRSLDFACGPLAGSAETPPPCPDACLVNCTARAAALQIRVNILTETVHAPWYYKLRMLLKAVLLW